MARVMMVWWQSGVIYDGDDDEIRGLVHWDLLRANMSCQPIEPWWTFVSAQYWSDLKEAKRDENGARQKVTQYLIVAIKTENKNRSISLWPQIGWANCCPKLQSSFIIVRSILKSGDGKMTWRTEWRRERGRSPGWSMRTPLSWNKHLLLFVFCQLGSIELWASL